MPYGSGREGGAFADASCTVLDLANLDSLNAKQIGLAITARIRANGFETGQVSERNMLPSATSVVEQLTMPIRLFWHMLAQISPAERTSWLIWTWLLVLLLLGKQKRRLSGSPIV